jgi:nicotinate-nucleotide adenylyltransferase
VADAPANSPARILIFGGTFDPPHIAHASLPELAGRQLGCDQVIYVPAAINPLKQDHPPTAKEHRLAMLLLAISGIQNAKISTIELDRKGPSYTIDTLRALRQQYASSNDSSRAKTSRSKGAKRSLPSSRPEFRLLIGCDQAFRFHEWKDWQEILTLATPAVMIRPPWTSKSLEQQLRARFSPVEAEEWLAWTLRLPLLDVNATDIRERLAKGESIEGLLDPAVAQYIRANSLYQ